MDAPQPAILLERIDALPSPSPMALRLLAVANDDASGVRDLVNVIRQDAALTAKVLSLCRRGPRGRLLDVASLDRATVLLGIGAVRAAALSVEFVEQLAHGRPSAAQGFDLLRFWRHSLGKAIVAESAAKLARGVVGGGRPFVVGLLHDLGALAFARVCPAECDRCCELSERDGRTLDELALETVGLSVATIGTRIAERWKLPDEVVESMRLRGDAALHASGPHRGLVLVAELADRTVRRRHVGGAGFGPLHDQIAPILSELKIDSARFTSITEGLFDEIAARAEAIGLTAAPSAAIAAESLERASRRLDLLRGPNSPRQPTQLDAVDEIDSAADVTEVLACVARGIGRLTTLDAKLLVVSGGVEGGARELREFSGDGSLLAVRTAGDGDRDAAAAIKRWCELRGGKAMPGRLELVLRGAVLATVYRAEGDVIPAAAMAQAPISSWRLALGAAVERERARRASERAAEATRLLAACRERLVRERSLASVAEIAAGLAHELNNPLAVASGRAQLLRRSIASGADVTCADEMIAAIERASGIVSELLRAVRPAPVETRCVRASEIIALAMRMLPRTTDASRVIVRDDTPQSAPPACVADPVQAADALAEVVQNALAASATGHVELRAECDESDSRCCISVRDTGPGFSERALKHGTDPFFSERASGRGSGLGLAKARAIVEACGGSIRMRNAADGGAIVTIVFARGGKDDGRGEIGDRGASRGPADVRREAA
ncbi:MAG: HDOD domain-containing protein [Phycisphaerales bacterium]